MNMWGFVCFLFICSIGFCLTKLHLLSIWWKVYLIFEWLVKRPMRFTREAAKNNTKATVVFIFAYFELLLTEWDLVFIRSITFIELIYHRSHFVRFSLSYKFALKVKGTFYYCVYQHCARKILEKSVVSNLGGYSRNRISAFSIITDLLLFTWYNRYVTCNLLN